jgi:poly-D-alanine transfer protein DltD
MPTSQPSTASGGVPDGIIAFVLAVAIAAAAGWAVRVSAQHVATRRLALLTSGDVPFKSQTLAFQRAALKSGHVLPVYGSSELFCCGRPFRPTDVFASGPTGFEVLALGHAGTTDLFFAETFAALGADLRGRRVVVSDSPTWFSNPDGPPPAQYGSNFLSEAAYAFTFTAPIPPTLRSAGALRLLAYPETLREQPLLRRALEDVAHPTRIARVDYATLAPLGRLATWTLDVRDAARAAFFLCQTRHRRATVGSPAPLDWNAMAERATGMAAADSTTNPFGFTDATYRVLRGRPRVRDALALYESGRTNRDGELLRPPRAWRRTVAHSAEWGDLRLALHVLRALGARPLVWSLPLPGTYYDYTPISAPARRRYYRRYERIATRAGFPHLDFRSHDEDRYFVGDPGSHLSARGWVFADRALDVFWHGGSGDDVRTALATLRRHEPG